MATDADIADRLSRRRARIIPVIAIIFITQQASFGTLNGRAVDSVKIAAWFVMSVALLIVLATGGGWARSKAVRELMNDETTHAHRQQAIVGGFFAAMAACIVIYGLSLVMPVTGMAAVHLTMTVGIAASLMRFGALERRAFRSGEQ